MIVHGDATGVDESVANGFRAMEGVSSRRVGTGSGTGAGLLGSGEMIRAGTDICVAMHRFVYNGNWTKHRPAGDRGGGPTYLHGFGAGGAEAPGVDDPWREQTRRARSDPSRALGEILAKSMAVRHPHGYNAIRLSHHPQVLFQHGIATPAMYGRNTAHWQAH